MPESSAGPDHQSRASPERPTAHPPGSTWSQSVVANGQLFTPASSPLDHGRTRHASTPHSSSSRTSRHVDPKHARHSLRDQARPTHYAEDRFKSSGGFLLDRDFTTIPGHGTGIPGDGGAATGERPREIALRRLQRQSLPASSSIQASLLGSRRSGELPGQETRLVRRDDADDILHLSSKRPAIEAGRHPLKQNGPAERSMGLGRQGQPYPGRASLDQDSARLVNLALNLSEARQRSASFGSPAVDHGKDGRPSAPVMIDRPVESAMPATAAPATAKYEMSTQERQRRRSKRHTSLALPATPRTPRLRTGSQDLRSFGSSSRSASQTLPFPDAQQDFEYHVSKATLARAEKAKLSFELAAEYRNLLECLPRLGSSSHHQPRTLTASSSQTLSGKASTSSTGQSPGRLYNPLQSIRNRRIRRRERHILEPDIDRWGDVRVVKAWVGTVEELATGTSLASPDGFHLPRFPPPMIEQDSAQSADPISPSTPRPPSGRQGVTRLDWFITPEELLADTYWLEQDAHKALIENREGLKIYPRVDATGLGTQKHESATRQRRPEKQRTSSFDIDPNRRHQPSRSYSEHDSPNRHHFRAGGRRGFHRSLDAHVRDVEDGIQRRHRWFGRRRGSTSSAESDGPGADTTQPTRGFNRRRSLEAMDRAHLDKQVRAMLSREAEEKTAVARAKAAVGDPETVPVAGETAGGNQVRDDQVKQAKSRTTSMDSARWAHGRPRLTKDSRRDSIQEVMESSAAHDGQIPSGSLESLDIAVTTDSAATEKERASSESMRGLAPSVVASMSSPSSRRASPDRNRGPDGAAKAASTRRSTSLERYEIEATDFAVGDGSQKTGLGAGSSLYSSSSTPPRRRPNGSAGHSPDKDTVELIGRAHTNGSIHGRLPDSSKSAHPRMRDRLKGVRIDEVLRKEVSKIGHFIWRREAPVDPAESSSPSSPSPSSSIESEDDARHHRLRKEPTNGSIQGPSSIEDGKLSRTTTASESPKYHSGLLPTFTPASAWNGAAKSPRPVPLDRVAQSGSGQSSLRSLQQLPSRTVSNLSLISSPNISRVDTQASNIGPSDSRRSSDGFHEQAKSPTDRAPLAIRDADDRLNAILGTPGRARFPVTALATVNPKQQQQQQRGSDQAEADSQRRPSSTEHGIPLTRQSQTRHDLARIEALLLSSGVKAQEIIRRAEQEQEVPPSLLLGRAHDASIVSAPHKKQHVLAAQLVIRTMQQTTRDLEASMRDLSESRGRALNERIRELQRQLSSELSPRVRAHADEADGFSTELVQTYTLRIKDINDSIDMVMRRRRRRFRWLRRGAYVLLEWILLGLMWWVWLIFVVFRMLRLTGRGFVIGLRWILWL